ncbi:MAG: hypothetical protein ACRCS9_01860 [Hyphomicrobium sp.]
MAGVVEAVVQAIARATSHMRALAVLALLVSAPLAAIAEPAAEPVPEAVRAAAEAATVAPDSVTIGTYINDIHELDFRSHSYAIDLYVWFRWKAKDANPAKSMEFMNRANPTDHQRDLLAEEPKAMPDGSYYAILRNQGRFSVKFRFERFPFDQQLLPIVMEDTLAGEAAQTYVADTQPVTINPDVVLPGYKVGTPRLVVKSHRYPTNFGDLSVGDSESYSRATIEIPVSRPLLTVSIKTFMPVLLLILSSAMVLIVRPSLVEGRIGLAITALLTLVALQLTASATLPDVDYLMLIDKVYLASYAFIIAVLGRVVMTSWVLAEADDERRAARRDRRWVVLLLVAYALAVGASLAWTFMRFV